MDHFLISFLIISLFLLLPNFSLGNMPIMIEKYLLFVFMPCIAFSQTLDNFPVHIGDIFEYESVVYESDQKTYYKTVITDIVDKNDGGIDIYFDNSPQPKYYKSIDGNIYYYVGGDPPPLWYDFTTNSLDTFYTHLSNTELLVIVFDGRSSIFGENRSARSFTFVDKNNNSPKAYHWVAEGFGIIEMTSYLYPPDVSRLVGCIINGKEYGTLVSVNTGPMITKFELFQNYPNPFNPSTTINFSIPHSDFITLKVFSLLGEEIATLIRDHLQAGSHSVQFDASNLQSGVYFCTLQSGSSRISKKMLLLK